MRTKEHVTTLHFTHTSVVTLRKSDTKRMPTLSLFASQTCLHAAQVNVSHGSKSARFAGRNGCTQKKALVLMTLLQKFNNDAK